MTYLHDSGRYWKYFNDRSWNDVENGCLRNHREWNIFCVCHVEARITVLYLIRPKVEHLECIWLLFWMFYNIAPCKFSSTILLNSNNYLTLKLPSVPFICTYPENTCYSSFISTGICIKINVHPHVPTKSNSLMSIF